jgi:hypothetical protein
MRNIQGLRFKGTQADIIVNDPFISPELPSPATARPIINMLLDTAMPQRREPNSKTAKKAKKVYYEAQMRN